MKLKEINLTRYGPLSQISLDLQEGLQVIHGCNESGKTLLVDAIVQRLAVGKGWLGSQLNRVDEDPEGFLILEHGGEELKAGAGFSLAEYLDVKPGDLRNIFVVRDADLIIEQEAGFYESITNRLTGIRTDEIRTIQEKLRELGNLTRTGGISNQSPAKVKDQLRDARRLLEDVSSYLERARKDGTTELEGQLMEALSKRERLGAQIALLERSKEKSEFLELKGTLEAARSHHKDLDNLPLKGDLSGLRHELEDVEDNLSMVPQIRRGERFLRRSGTVALPFMLVIGILALILQGPSGLLVFFASAMAWGLVAILWLVQHRKLGKVESRMTHLANRAGTIGIAFQDVGELSKAIKDLEGRIESTQTKLNEQVGILKHSLDLADDGVTQVLQNAAAVLSAMEEGLDPEAPAEFDAREYKNLQGEIEIIDSQIPSLQDRLGSHEAFLKQVDQGVLSLDFISFTGAPLGVDITNFEALEDLSGTLSELSRRIEEKAEVCRAAISVWEAVEVEEEKKVATLFGPDSKISEIYAEITDNRYDSVSYDHEGRQILLHRPSGKSFPVGSLSRGARDQLYFAIRMVLGSMILKGGTGFFLLDEAFLSSDAERLKRQLGFLTTIVERGWQVIYFTAQDDVVQGLDEHSRRHLIELPALP